MSLGHMVSASWLTRETFVRVTTDVEEVEQHFCGCVVNLMRGFQVWSRNQSVRFCVKYNFFSFKSKPNKANFVFFWYSIGGCTGNKSAQNRKRKKRYRIKKIHTTEKSNSNLNSFYRDLLYQSCSWNSFTNCIKWFNQSRVKMLGCL